MKIFRIEDTYIYVGTLGEAHKEMKRLLKEGDFKDWRDVGVVELDVPNDKAGILALLNETGSFEPTGRRWEFGSPRLGLVESTGLE